MRPRRRGLIPARAAWSGHLAQPRERPRKLIRSNCSTKSSGSTPTILAELAQAGAAWVQIDEPVLVTDLTEQQRRAFTRSYARLKRSGVKIMLATYFGGLEDNLSLAATLPVDGLHVDIVRAPHQLAPLLETAPKNMLLSLGVVDGRNVWRADLSALLDWLEPIASTRDLALAPSCSLLHVPLDLALEPKLDDELRQWLAFAVQKLEELNVLKYALNEGRAAVADALEASDRAAASRRTSPAFTIPPSRRRGRSDRQDARAQVALCGARPDPG